MNDIAQVNVTSGGANAVDFNRSGGFQIDSVSKSGTNKFSGQLGFRCSDANFVADQEGTQHLSFDNDRAGRPRTSVVRLCRIICSSTVRSTARSRSAQTPANLYGELPDYQE